MRPRIRSIKPEAVKDPELWDAEVESGLPLFRAFVGLWCCADREGRFEWKPRELKLECLPWWEGDFSRVLDALATSGFLVKYSHKGRHYGFVRTFSRHQSINNRESASELPEPTEESIVSMASQRVVDACTTRVADAVETTDATSLPFPSPKGGVGGRRWRRVPKSWNPTDEHRELAESRGLDFEDELATFRDYDFDKPKKDADATFRNWLRNSKKSKATPNGKQQTEWEGAEKWV